MKEEFLLEKENFLLEKIQILHLLNLLDQNLITHNF